MWILYTWVHYDGTPAARREPEAIKAGDLRLSVRKPLQVRSLSGDRIGG